MQNGKWCWLSYSQEDPTSETVSSLHDYDYSKT